MILEYRIHRHLVCLVPDLLLDRRQLIVELLLVCGQLLPGSGRDLAHIQPGGGSDLLLEGFIPSYLHADKARHLRRVKRPQHRAAPACMAAAIHIKIGHLAAPHRDLPDLARHRIGHRTLHGAFQDIDLGVPAVDHLHPSGCSPDPGHHGRGADI